MTAMPTNCKLAGPGLRPSPAPPAATSRQFAQTLTVLSHDLRSPLTVIRASAQLLDRYLQAADGIPGGATQQAALIIQAAARLAGMMDQLQELARSVASHAPPLDRLPVDLVTLARSVADEHSVLWGGRAITVVSPSSDLLGLWDTGKLARVCANLLTNALKYSSAGTPVTISVQHEGDAWARLEVSDAGIGIPAADLPHVFKVFFRGANAGNQADGSGVGLASVRAIVEQHGGTVAVASVEGQGTTVTVRLPLHPPSEAT